MMKRGFVVVVFRFSLNNYNTPHTRTERLVSDWVSQSFILSFKYNNNNKLVFLCCRWFFVKIFIRLIHRYLHKLYYATSVCSKFTGGLFQFLLNDKRSCFVNLVFKTLNFEKNICFFTIILTWNSKHFRF